MQPPEGVIGAQPAHCALELTCVRCRYELLTGKALFPRGSNKGTICAQLAGRQPLPWEDPTRQAELDHMKGLKRSVLRCLSRNPSQRPTSDLLIRR